MADLIRGLEALAHPRVQVGAEEMIERVEAQLADDALVVVTSRPRDASQAGDGYVLDRRSLRDVRNTLAWTLAGTIIVIGIVWVSAGTGGEESPSSSPVITTVADPIDTSKMSNPELVEAGIRAWYEGDREAVAQLFDFGFRSRWSSEDLEAELAYQRQSSDLATADCVGDGDELLCEIQIRTAMDAALGRTPSSETAHFGVSDATIVPIDDRFPVPVWTEGSVSVAVYLRLHGRIIYAEPWDTQLKEYALECLDVPREEFCASLEEKNLDGWAAWYPGRTEEMVEVQVTAWFGGDCERAYLVVGELAPTADINCPDLEVQYETAIGAMAHVAGCARAEDADVLILECEILYENVMSRAVDKGPVSVARSYEVGAWLTELDDNYPEDEELIASFGRYAQESGIAGEYESACPARQPSCADFILNRLDDWATWYLDNS